MILKKYIVTTTILLIFGLSFIVLQCNQDYKPKQLKNKRLGRLEHIDSESGYVFNEGLNQNNCDDNIPEYDLKVNKKIFKYKKLAKGLNGFKIGILTDLHIKFMKDSYLEKIVQEFSKQKPDIIFFLGDLVNYHAKEVDPAKITILRKLLNHTKYGVFSILGNHDYGTFRFLSTKKAAAGYDLMMEQAHQKLGWTLLKNTHAIIKHNGCPIKIIGIEHLSYCSTVKNRGDIDKAISTPVYQGHDNKSQEGKEDCFDILIAHDPDVWAYVYQNYQIPLTLSGHTHGSKSTGEFDTRKLTDLLSLITGKVKAPEIDKKCNLKESKAGFCLHRYYGGTYHYKDSYLYVDQGCGFSGASLELNRNKNSNLDIDIIMRNRSGVQPEISFIKLVAKDK